MVVCACDGKGTSRGNRVRTDAASGAMRAPAPDWKSQFGFCQ